MSDCNEDLIKAKGVYPRTCARCKLGPCSKYPPKVVYVVSAEGGPYVELLSAFDAKEALWEFAKSWPRVSVKIKDMSG